MDHQEKTQIVMNLKETLKQPITWIQLMQNVQGGNMFLVVACISNWFERFKILFVLFFFLLCLTYLLPLPFSFFKFNKICLSH